MEATNKSSKLEITVKTYKPEDIEEKGIDATAIDKAHHLALHLMSKPIYDDGVDYCNDFVYPREACFILYDPTQKDSEHNPFRADSGRVDPEDNVANAPTSSGKFYLAGQLHDNRPDGYVKSLKKVNLSLETRPINYDNEDDTPMIPADCLALRYFRPLLKALITSDEYIKIFNQVEPH